MSKIMNIVRHPSVVGQYIKGVRKEHNAQNNCYQLAFNKESDGCWYIDLPQWQGAHANLMMVAGADKLIEFVGGGNPRVEVKVVKSNQPIEELDSNDSYFRCDQLDQSLFGGSTYEVNLSGFDGTMWLCPVTLFVLGEYPKYLYIKK